MLPDHENTATSVLFAACADDVLAAADAEEDAADADELPALEAVPLCAADEADEEDEALACDELSLRDDEHPPSSPAPTTAAPIAPAALKSCRLVMLPLFPMFVPPYD